MVGFAIYESYTYGIVIRGNGRKDEFFASVTLECSAPFSLQELSHRNLAYLSAFIDKNEPSFFFIFMNSQFQAIILPVVFIQYLVFIRIHQTDDCRDRAVAFLVIVQGIVAQT